MLRALARDDTGSMVIETAIIAPVLALMSIGAFQVSAIVARQQELQSGASEAAMIALASSPSTDAKKATVRSIIQTSLDLPADKVAVTTVYRCDVATTYVTRATDCASGVITATYLRIVITDTYTPEWTKLGVGEPFTFNVVRTVQIA